MAKHFKTFDTIKNDYLKTARELCYSESIIQRILDATSEIEMDRAMIQGRKEKFDEF